MTAPVTSEFNGRTKKGKFAPGNKFARGNPINKKVHQLRSALMKSVSSKDIRAIIQQLVEQAKAGDVMAAREVFDRIYGKARQGIDIESQGDSGGLQFIAFGGAKIVKPDDQEGGGNAGD